MTRALTAITFILMAGCGPRSATDSQPATSGPLQQAQKAQKAQAAVKRISPRLSLAVSELKFQPLFKTLDLDIGETANVAFADDRQDARGTIKLLAVEELVGTVRGAIRSATVKLAVNDAEVVLPCGNFTLPTDVGPFRIDCNVTNGYTRQADANVWGLTKRVRIRVWPQRSRLVRKLLHALPCGTDPHYFRKWGENQPIDAGLRINRDSLRYESGICFGTAPSRLPVFNFAAGRVVSVGGRVWSGWKADSVPLPFPARIDCVTVLDGRGWLLVYDHITSVNDLIELGSYVETGQLIGIAGSSRGIPGHSTFRFEIRARQPSGLWGTVPAYALLKDVAEQRKTNRLRASAQCRKLVHVGESTTLDGTRSWSSQGKIRNYKWLLADGTERSGPRTQFVHTGVGTYCHILRVEDARGATDYDIVHVGVVKRGASRYPPSLHITANPVMRQVKRIVEFGVRVNGSSHGLTTIDFNSGPPAINVRCRLDEYTRVVEKFEHAGHFVIRAEHRGARGIAQTAIVAIVEDSEEKVNR